MEKNRLKSFLPVIDLGKNINHIIKYSGGYIIMMSVMIIPVFVIVIYMHSYNYKAYCDYPKEGEFYHFIVEGEEHCLIKWANFLITPTIGTVAFWSVFVFPVVVLRRILKYLWKNNDVSIKVNIRNKTIIRFCSIWMTIISILSFLVFIVVLPMLSLYKGIRCNDPITGSFNDFLIEGTHPCFGDFWDILFFPFLLATTFFIVFAFPVFVLRAILRARGKTNNE